MARTNNTINKKGGFAFLGKDLKRYVGIVITIATIFVVEKILNYHFLIIQKEIQNGKLEHWHDFLILMVFVLFLEIVSELFKMSAGMWMSKIQKINFFKRYDGIIQQDGKLEICQLQLEFATAKAMAIIEICIAIISIVYTILMMGIVEMDVPKYIGAGLILLLGIIFGWRRGVLQQKTDSLGSKIFAKQQILSNFFMISSNVLDERLEEIDKSYREQIVLQVQKNALRLLPKFIKSIIYLAFMWEILSNLPNEGVYSYSYIVLTAYGYIVEVADQMGYVLEDCSKILKYYKDERIHALNTEEELYRSTATNQTDNIIMEESQLIIKKEFSADVTRQDGTVAWYTLTEDLNLKKGEMIALEGENGTGKSRINRLIREIVPGTLGYDVKTNIMSKYIENFRYNSEIDAALIMRLASGLGVKRVPQNEEQLYKMDIKKALNGADRQLLIAIQILYFAIKEHNANPEKLQLIILDEILGNVSINRAPKVLNFMKQELSRIGACTILVSHAHKKVVHKYVDSIWSMTNEGDKIKIQRQK